VYNATKAECKYAMYSNSSSSLNMEIIRDRFVPGHEERGWYGCTAIRPMTSNYNDTPRVAYETLGNRDQICFTDKLQYPEAMARWCDLFYNMNVDVRDNEMPNSMMLYKGFYGVHWEYTDWPENKHWTFLDRPDGSASDDGDTRINWDYARAYINIGWNHPCGLYVDETYADGSPMYVAKQLSNETNEYPYVSADTEFPRLARWSEEETNAAATKLTDLQNYLLESWGLFMSGQMELNDANWDTFVATCDALGAQEITDIYQQVYERWNSALMG
jgi:hypothetical protein